MPFRNNQSYVRFPEPVEATPGNSLEPASVLMNQLINENKSRKHLHDQQTVASQDVFNSLKIHN